MWHYFLIFALILVVILPLELKKHHEAKAVLRHTIRVNLSILKPELEELSAIAAASQTEEAQQARTILDAARVTADNLEPQLDSASRRKLGSMLSEVFQAMSKSTDARHLLNACVPMEWR